MIREAYRKAGVDVGAGDRAVELMRARVESTFGPDVLTGIGSFAAAVALPVGMTDPVLVSATDGVGTKTAIASELGRYDTIGIDLVAMCADDVACLGARPWFFLDYVALERLDPVMVARLVEGITTGCRSAGCALVGGETAEHPGVMAARSFDLAGFCVGIAERAELIAEPAGVAGDVLIGIASSGLHSNGFSLVRRIVTERKLDLAEAFAGTSQPLGEALLTPSRIYAPDVLALREHLAGRGLAVRGFAHITGGGLPGNVPRVLADRAAARVDPGRWPAPALQVALANLAGLDGAEMRSVFNGGIGMVAVVERAAADTAIEFLGGRGLDAWHIGDVVAAVDERRYIEERLS